MSTRTRRKDRAVQIAATALTGILAGASLDQSIKQLPARRRIGVLAFARYSQAADLASGVPWYASLGIGAAALTLAATARCLLGHGAPHQRWPLLVAGALTVAHTFTTARAAPINFSQRAAGDDEAALTAIFGRFERWQALRAGLQLATFLVMLRALVVNVVE
jgi:hypothetical protein